ncbi:unnamed protein product (macronuclear) [Paramecium tetraurelia]|uniref:PAS domain-containing protein n=1 Tax=Paramecium tetraurelia TaxID=5888 RepID=A0CB00_PARTE|nr:uncharacterized protein GSPATT00036750001 [Paramecium tetraurelia]CAK67967.1 unnamed protein product [Paramecium tetraurelia]|eukprot:XP_001435364.1 hypothetical protein (macronuclear) [Paramecium tetraurelia strain d4-2]
MSDSQNDINSTIIMITFCFQRISLLFSFDQFADKPYEDYKLQFLQKFFNWFTLQTPIHMINSQHFSKIAMYIICVYLWLIIIIMFTKVKWKILLQNFFAFYQLLIIIPLIEHMDTRISQNEDLLIGIVTLIPLTLCYIFFFLIHRNYLLPQKNIYMRRYSYSNILMIVFDISIMITIQMVDELISSILIIFMSILLMIDSFLIQPYSYQVNMKYISATSFIFCASTIKIFSFKISQEETFYCLILLVPMITVIFTQFFQRLVHKQIFDDQLGLAKLLAIIDLINDKKTNHFQMISILNHMKQQHKIIIDNDNIYVKIQQTVIQLFDIVIAKIKTQDSTILEQVQLYKILYITNTCKRVSLGYIELKIFIAVTQKQSLYFTIISKLLQEKMSKRRKYFNDQEQRLSLIDIRKAELLYEDSINLIVNILDMKIKFWIDLEKGYQRIEEFALSAYNLSEKIWQLRDFFFVQFSIEPLKLQSRLVHFNILELKLLAILYSAILNDYHATLDIEQKVEEIVQNEKNSQNEYINNITLINDDLVMMAVSFVKQKNQILNKNRGQIAKFFGYENEKDFLNIISIEQLMPPYIQQSHDTLLRKYLKKGYSSFFVQSKEVYIKMKTNFIQAVNMNLLHMYEQDSDYIITGALQKVKQMYDFIIFDRKGKILGISEQIFKIFGSGFSIEQLLNRGYIYFWIPNVFEIIQEEKGQLLENTEIQSRSMLKQQFLFSINNFNQLCQDHELSRTNSTVKNQQSQKFYTELNETEQMISVGNVNSIHFLKDQNVSLINEFLTKYNQSRYVDQDNLYSMKYSISFNVIGGDLLPQFVIQINEIEKVNPKKQGQTFSVSLFSTIKKSTINDRVTESCFVLEHEMNDNNLNIQINPPIINKMSRFQDSKLEDSSNKYPIYNQSNEQFKLISPRGNKEILIGIDDYEDEEDDQKFQDAPKSSSQQHNNQPDVIQAIQQYKELDQEFKENAKQSQSSGTSDRTQMSVFNILKNLQYSQRYQTTLIKVFINTLFLFIILLFLIVLQLVISRSNTNNLQYQIPLVGLPDEFSRIYNTFTVLGQMDIEIKILNMSHGVYYDHRIEVDSTILRENLLTLIVEIEKEFSKLEQQGKLNQAQVKIVTEYSFDSYNISILQFNQMVNEYTEALDQLFDYDNQQDVVNEQIRLMFFKANLNNLLDFVSNLINNIVNEFFTNIENYELLYLIFLFIELLIIIVAILMQFNLWVDPYVYKQKILLMIQRVQEKEIDLLLLKYKTFKEILLNDINKWKQVNYFKEFFTCRISQLRKIQNLKQQHEINKKQQKLQQRAKINTRIQETQYSVIHIYFMLLFLWLVMTSFVLSSYLYQYINITNSYPELNLCMQFVRFKQEFDATMIISQLMKNAPLLNQNQIESGIFNKKS